MTCSTLFSGRPTLWLAVLFYAAFAAGACLWAGFQGTLPSLVANPDNSYPSLIGGTATGLTLGLVAVLLSRWTLARYRWAQDLYDWFGGALGPMGPADPWILAFLSAVGEEMLFRGPMLNAWGMGVTTLVFGLLHWAPQKEFWPWTVMAAALGLVFAVLTRLSGNLAGAVVAHFVINGLNLSRVRELSGPEPRSDQPDAISSWRGRLVSQKLPELHHTHSMDGHDPTAHL